MTITATLDGILNPGQSVYLRYSTDNFASSTVVEMTGAGTSAVIPGMSEVTVKYYVFTSGAGLTISGADADWYTINGNNNGGSNYSYTLGVLPIKLTSFTAKKQGNTTQLNWTTSTEENNDFFTIEKSLDGERFEVIGTKAGAGNSLEAIEYSFIDEKPANGVNYYRLKQTDFDGRFTYSEVVSVEFDTKIQATIYPNPTSEKLTINTEIQDVVNVRIFNVNGQVVYQNTQRIDNQTEIDLGELSAGNYFLMITNDATQKAIFSSNFVKN